PQDAVRDRTEVRIRRQEVLRKATPPHLSIIVPESVLHQTTGSREIMAAQLNHVIEVADRAAVELLIVPSVQAITPASIVGTEVLDFSSQPPIAYVENLSGGSIIDGPSVAVYERYFEGLRELAAGPEASLNLV